MSDGSQWGAPPADGYPDPEQPGAVPWPGQPPYDQAAYGQASYGQAPYQQAPAAYGQAPYGQLPYGQAPYAQVPYGQSPYGQVPYWQGPYGHPGYGSWRPAPIRPTVVTSAGVLGIVTGALTALGSLIMLIAALSGEGDAVTMLLVLGLPCAAGLIAGGVRLLRGHSSGLLFGSALAAIGILAVALIAGMLTLADDDQVGVAAFVLFACVLPIITAVFARLRGVADWGKG